MVRPEELAWIYMKSRPDFLIMDMEEATNHWNLNYIYEFLYHVRKLSDIDLAINWLAEKWADTHHYYDTYYNLKDPKLVEEYQRFVLTLKDIKDSLLNRFEAEERKEALRVQMLMGYNTTTITEETTEGNLPQNMSDETSSYLTPDVTEVENANEENASCSTGELDLHDSVDPEGVRELPGRESELDRPVLIVAALGIEVVLVGLALWLRHQKRDGRSQRRRR